LCHRSRRKEHRQPEGPCEGLHGRPPFGARLINHRNRDAWRVVALFAFVCPGSRAGETNPRANKNHTTTTRPQDVKRTSPFAFIFASRKFLVQCAENRAHPARKFSRSQTKTPAE
jgi:hypothetical protein